jgi:mRNA interferase MazF
VTGTFRTPRPRRGEIYWIDWSPQRGSEQAGRRPGLVISGDSFNRMFPVVTVLALTTTIRESSIAVTLPASVTGQDSAVLPWQVMTADQGRLENKICDLPTAYMLKVDKSLALVWGLAPG